MFWRRKTNIFFLKFNVLFIQTLDFIHSTVEFQPSKLSHQDQFQLCCKPISYKSTNIAQFCKPYIYCFLNVRVSQMLVYVLTVDNINRVNCMYYYLYNLLFPLFLKKNYLFIRIELGTVSASSDNWSSTVKYIQPLYYFLYARIERVCWMDKGTDFRF